MRGFLKNLFRKADAEEAASQPVSPAPAPVAAATSPAPAGIQRQPAAAPNGNGRTNGNALYLPLSVILQTLPLELRAKVRNPDVGDLSISLPLNSVLSQLAFGTVKITFGELRRMAPESFSPETGCDKISVSLPLNEILARLNPALFVRRTNQKQVEVPLDIGSPFDNHGRGISLSEPAAPKPAPLPKSRPLPAPRRDTHVAPLEISQPVPAPAPRQTITAVAAPAPPPATAPAAPPAIQMSTALRNLTTATLAAPSPAPAPAPQPAAAAPAPAAQPKVRISERESMIVPLGVLAESWPDAVRQEIVQLNLMDARVALPASPIEQALKRGRIAFTWKVLHSWIKPSPLPIVSAHDGAILELPLKVIAPLFVTRQKASKTQEKTQVNEDIPNLFFGFPQPEAGGPRPNQAVAKPVDTNYYIWDDAAERAKVEEAPRTRKPPTGTDFVTRCATPNEVVSRAAALEGVAGVVIALPDGLMVANRIPAEFNPDTLAAFLPQIFGKISQCTKELRMGELNNVNFTVGNVPWKIFRVNAIFFAAFGLTGKPLPTAQLAALAAELDHKNK